MSASIDDIATLTVDGVLLVKSNTAVRAAFPNAIDMTDERESFCVDAADAQVLQDELASILMLAPRAHEAVELEDSPVMDLSGALPWFTTVDDERNLTAKTVPVSIAFDMLRDRYLIELIQIP